MGKKGWFLLAALSVALALGGCGDFQLSPEQRQELVTSMSDIAGKAGETAARKLIEISTKEIVDAAKKVGLDEGAAKKLEETFLKKTDELAAKAGELARVEAAKVADSRLPKPKEGGGGGGILGAIIPIIVAGLQLYSGKRG